MGSVLFTRISAFTLLKLGWVEYYLWHDGTEKWHLITVTSVKYPEYQEHNKTH